MDSTNTPRPDGTATDSTDGVLSLRQKAKAMYRQAVLDAAEQIFATQGLRGARIQDIAKLAGMSVGTVYNHFAQKEDIVVALITEREKELRDAFDAKPGDPPDFCGALRARHERVMRLIREHMDFYSFALYEGIFESDLVPPDSMFATQRYDDAHERFDTAMEELLAQGVSEGQVEPQDLVRLKRFHAGAMRGVLMGAMKDPSLDPVEEGKFALEMFLRAIRPDPAG
jgi:AcrR family transcriptional regulator